MTSWICENTLTVLQRICFYVLKCGDIPDHIAIIMDGNRRYAKKTRVKNTEGHKKGFEKLAETLQWCLDLDVREVSVYAFSIENFKRNKEEVNTLMQLAKEKFRMLIEEWKKLRDHGICIRVIGNFKYLPHDLVILMLIAMLLTKENKRGCLNIVFSYTSRDEMSNTCNEIISSVRQKDCVVESDINAKFFDRCLYTFQSRHPDLMIRTSGEIRLSDYLTWQGAHSYTYYSNALWPEFSVWHLMRAIFCWQHASRGKSLKTRHSDPKSSSGASNFISNLHSGRLRTLIDNCLAEQNLSDFDQLDKFSEDKIYEYYKLNIAHKVDTEKID